MQVVGASAEQIYSEVTDRSELPPLPFLQDRSLAGTP